MIGRKAGPYPYTMSFDNAFCYKQPVITIDDVKCYLDEILVELKSKKNNHM
jgi:hypothetical protein